MTAFAEGFLFGLANSLHCAAMCGPLALFFTGRRAAAASYHAGRIAGYCAAGTAAGGLGAWLGARSLAAPGAAIALVLGACLLFAAAGVGPHFARVPGLHRATAAAMRRVARWTPASRGAALGLLTPLLPCGLAYAAFGAAAIAGSPAGGAAVLLGFAAGGAPLLLFAQLNAGLLRRWLGPAAAARFARGAMAAAAALLIWRAAAALGQAPSCCT
jgi:sulfite exporter TauE/SafE